MIKKRHLPLLPQRTLLTFVFFIFHFKNLPAQTGCTDPLAINFNPSATQNDGSCAYPYTQISPVLKADLPDTLREISGIIAAGGRWWTHNDGGNDHTFFRFDPEQGTVNQYVKLKQANNEDWEDITTDGTNLFIGDFGNNAGGNRTDLGIYRVPLAKIGNGTTTSVEENEYAFLPFAYADQTDFTPAASEDDIVFDCEAMLFFEGKIHLFQKNWRDRTTTHYVVNQALGLAEPLETFDAQGLVTSAALSPDGKLVALLVYNKSPLPEVYVWLLWDFRDGRFFNGNRRRIEFGSPLIFGKAEAIAFSGMRKGYVGNEYIELGGITLVEQQIRTFDFSQFVPEMVGAGEAAGSGPESLRIFPNPFSQRVDFQFFKNEKPDFFKVKNLLGEPVFDSKTMPDFLETSAWPPGTYIFEAGFRGRIISFARVKI